MTKRELARQCDINHIHWNMHEDCNDEETIKCYYNDNNDEYHSFYTNINDLQKINKFDDKSQIRLTPWLLYDDLTNVYQSPSNYKPCSSLATIIYPKKPLTTGEVLQLINNELNKKIDIESDSVSWHTRRAIFGLISDHYNYVELITKLEKKELSYRDIFHWSREFEGLDEITPNVFEVIYGT